MKSKRYELILSNLHLLDLHDIMILQISLQKTEFERSEHYLCFFYSNITSVSRRAKNKWKKDSARFAETFAVV